MQQGWLLTLLLGWPEATKVDRVGLAEENSCMDAINQGPKVSPQTL